MITIQILGINYNFPNSWDDITVAQYRNLITHTEDLNPARIVSIFTGIDYELLEQYDQTKLANTIFPLVEWMEDKLNFADYPVPDEIKIGDKMVDVVKDISNESAGQNWVLQQYMAGSDPSKGYADIISDSVAVMLQPNYTGQKFDDKTVGDLKKLIDQCKVTQAYPVAAFFLSRVHPYESVKRISYTLNPTVRKFKQMSVSSMNWDCLTPCTGLRNSITPPLTMLAN